MGNQAFYYINGEPLNGVWIDLEYIDSIDEVLEELAEEGVIPHNADGEPEYGGDLLVADTEGGLAHLYYESCGSFNLEEFIEVRDSDVDEDVAIAYISNMHQWNEEDCSEKYYGQFDSVTDFAEHDLDSSGLLAALPDDLKCHFDYESYGNDLLISDFFEVDGHYFYNR